jgi:hypothetical protein
MDESTQVEVEVEVVEDDEQEKYQGGEIPRVEPPIEPDAPSREDAPEPQPSE